MLKVPLEKAKQRKNSVSSMGDESFDPRSTFPPIFRTFSHC